MSKKKNKTIWGVVGVILILFGVTGTIPILVNRQYLGALPLTGVSIIIGVLLIAWMLSD
ncbi:MAG: hypothetical protein AABY22_17565 [Nanoarchaeota archaeon]